MRTWVSEPAGPLTATETDGTSRNELGAWKKDGSLLACIVNFAAVPHHDYRVGLPAAGRWTELLNTDAEVYSGSGVGNMGQVVAEDAEWHGQPASTSLRVPPLGTVWIAVASYWIR